jgi:hypothetical protein
MTGPHSGAPPGNESRPWQGGSRDITDANSVTDAGDNSLPHHRPWRDRAVELRFREDRAQWRRRIECARRLSYYGRDPVSPRGGWSS